jgi:hypothetical protein
VRDPQLAKATMAVHDFLIQIAIALLVFTLNKSSADTSDIPKSTNNMCIPDERSALLAFKAGLSDHANLLSSWKGDDCCRWKGVHCSIRTGHVVKLDLQGPDCDSRKRMLGGNISISMIGLKHLQYLNLSCNQFDMVIPEFLGSLHDLRYLDLSQSSLIGHIPPHLGNISNLHYSVLIPFLVPRSQQMSPGCHGYLPFSSWI